MTRDIEKFVNSETQPATQIGWAAGLVDRRNDTQHVLRTRQLRREADEVVAREGVKLLGQLARLERYGRANTEVKFQLERAKRESQILAQDDTELRTKFGVLDDDLLQRFRLDLQGGA